MAGPKTTQELDIRQLKKDLGLNDSTKYGDLFSIINKQSLADFKELLDNIKNLHKQEEKRLSVYKELSKYIKDHKNYRLDIADILDAEINKQEELVVLDKKRTKAQKGLNALLGDGNRLLQKTIQNNAEIFRISHEMQLESNVTWKNYTRLYDEAYKSVREANREIGQSVHNVKDLVSVQNQLLGAGWKNIDVKTLTSVSTSVVGLQRTLGKLDTRLITAFEQSYRLFGVNTDVFVTAIGNRLNAFSNTFGVNIGLLQGAVSEMVDANNFIHRSNMQANIKANESLIKAAALSGAIGLTSTTFLTSLAKTTQFGTMEEMSQIYQGGALLQGFDTGKFQQQMISGQYEDATRSLLESIHTTLSGIDDHYLRAEYMSRISSTFGLSKDELARIATHGDKLDEYSADLQDKLLGVNTSIEDELRDLKVSLADRIENAIQNSWSSQAVGSAMQELGIYGLSGILSETLNWVRYIALKPELGKLTSKVFGGATGAGGSAGLSLGSKLGIGALGLGVGVGSNLLGSAIQGSGAIKNDALANILGGFANIAGGAAGGIMMGSMLGPLAPIGMIAGGLIGAGLGIGNTISGAETRQSKLDEMAAAKRSERDSTLKVNYTGDPLIDAINNQTVVLSNILNNNHLETKNIKLISDTYKQTTTVEV